MVGVFCFFIPQFFKASTKLAVLGLVVLLTPTIVYRAAFAWKHLDMTGPPILADGILKGMRSYNAEVRFWDPYLKLAEKMKKDFPGIPIMVEGQDALYANLATNLRNAGPFYIIWGELGNPERDLERRQFVGSVRPVILTQGAPREWVASTTSSLGYTRSSEFMFGEVNLFFPPKHVNNALH